MKQIPSSVAGIFLACIVAACSGHPRPAEMGAVVVGSKTFTESVIIAEIATGLIRAEGIDVRHRRSLGGTRFLWNALLAGEIDLYSDYSGTIVQEILAGRVADYEEALAAMDSLGLTAIGPIGFNNTYALGMNADRADALRIASITDLARHPNLQFAFSNEFMDRGDGWPALRAAYGLPQTKVRGVDHDLAYRGLAAGSVDVIDLYSTDAEIAYYGLRVLRDDRSHFPDYQALLIVRRDLIDRLPDLHAALSRLTRRISEPKMIAMNHAVKIDGQSESVVARHFLETDLGVEFREAPETVGPAARIWRRTLEHLVLVGISLGIAIIVAIPLGILAAKNAQLSGLILGVVGVIYTIPSLALLVFMIPLIGIGGPPAIVALFLYSLLPIVRNTYTGLTDIGRPLMESAIALGISSGARLRLIELPLASRAIIGGIKTSAVINVGTATLGALIGAGGYGQPILTGIRLDDVGLILEGAVPAALLALAAQGLFELIERLVVPRGLRLDAR